MGGIAQTSPNFYCRFYQCFESIQLYGVSLVQLVDDLEGGRLVEVEVKKYRICLQHNFTREIVRNNPALRKGLNNKFLLFILRFIQQSLETLLRLQEGRQLLAEV